MGRALGGQLDRRESEATFGWVTFVPFSAEHAYHAAELEAALRERSDVDQARVNALAGNLLIAALPKAEDADVVTDNVDDFALFEGVRVDGLSADGRIRRSRFVSASDVDRLSRRPGSSQSVTLDHRETGRFS